jgi:cysteine desulfuration protein SufE
MATFQEIVGDFTFLDDWEDRYKYLIDLGRRLEPFPEYLRDAAHKVKGCASQVWLDVERRHDDRETRYFLRGDSDAHIVKGLVALLIALYSGRTAAEIRSIDAAKALEPLDLQSNLTPQRSNGLASMIRRIGELASA